MSFQHIIQMSLNRSTANRWITTFSNTSITYDKINLRERLRQRNILLIKIPNFSSISTVQKRIKQLLHQIEFYNPVISVFILSDRILFQSVQLRQIFKTLLPTNPIEMRNVTIHEKQEPIVLTCKRCQNVWEYHGNNPYVAKCSFCKTTVSVLKQKQNHQVPQPGQSTNQAQVAETTTPVERSSK